MQAATNIHLARGVSRNKIAYKRACPNGPNSGSRKPFQNWLRSKGLPSCSSGGHKPHNFNKNQSIVLLQPCCEKCAKFNLNTLLNLGPHAEFSKEIKKSMFTVPFLGPSGGWDRKIAKSTAWADPSTIQKPYLRFVYSARNIKIWNKGSPYKRSLMSSDFPAPKMEPQSGHTASAVSVHWLQCGNCDAAPPTQHSPMQLYSAYSATPRHVSHENLNVNNTISKTWGSKQLFKNTPSDVFP